MLDIQKVDLSSIAEALEDHSYYHTWWLDPETGEVEIWSEDLKDIEEDPPDERGLVSISPIDSHEGYGDMQDFITRVRDPRARDLLNRAIEGRGAFRRFKDTLLEFPELRDSWFAFHDARMHRRAIEWLVDNDLIDSSAGPELVAQLPNPDFPEALEEEPFDPPAIAEAVAEDLRTLYDRRLDAVLLFGSWARGDAHPESDIDLLVVLDTMESLWRELRRMEPILWRHSFEHNTVITAVPVERRNMEDRRWPLLRRLHHESRRIA